MTCDHCGAAKTVGPWGGDPQCWTAACIYRRAKTRVIGLVVAGLCLSSPATAATLYVNNSGSPACSDNTTKANNSASQPWCTLGRAVWGNADRDAPNASQAAAAGDTVLVTPGTYETNEGVGSDESLTTYDPVNNGSSGNPIIFQCATYQVMPPVCILTYGASSPGGTIIGASGSTWITWRGFSFEEAESAVCLMSAANIRSADGVRLEWLQLVMSNACRPEDNHIAVFIYDSQDVAVRNNKISGARNGQGAGGAGNENGAGIMIYGSGDIVLEHNEIYDSGAGIAIKSPCCESDGSTRNANFAEITVRYNLIWDVDFECIDVFLAEYTSSEPARIYQNICRDSGACFIFHFLSNQAGDPRPKHSYFVNNVCHNWPTGSSQALSFEAPASTGFDANAGNKVRNNIFRSGGTVVYMEIAASEIVDTKLDQDYNWFSSYTTFSAGNISGTLTNWINNTEADDNSTNSTDPQFENEAADDFRLAAGSPARNACVDVLDLDGDSSTSDLVNCGAYITHTETIGIEVAAAASGRRPPFLIRPGDD